MGRTTMGERTGGRHGAARVTPGRVAGPRRSMRVSGWKNRRPWLALGLASLALAAPLRAQAGPDETGVRRAALDYLEGFYEGSDEKLRRSIHPDVDKFGFYRPSADAPYQRSPMSFQEMFDFAAGVRNGRGVPPAGAPKEVIPLDIQDQTAVVKVVAWWGQDYLHMARYDGKWMIVHVLWQSLES